MLAPALIRRRRYAGPLNGRNASIRSRAFVDLPAGRHLSEHGVWIDRSGHGHHAQFGSVHVAFVGDDNSGVRCLHMLAVAANFASTPDAAVLDIVGDIDIRCDATPDDLTPALEGSFLSKRDSVTAYQFTLEAAGTLKFRWDDGSVRQVSSSAAVPGSNGDRIQFRVTLDVNDGAGGHVLQFFTKTTGSLSDSTGWTQLGTDVDAGAFTTSINSTADDVEVGSRTGGTNHIFVGKIYRAQIYDGIAGTLVFDPDFTKLAQGVRSFAEDANGATVTVNQSGADTNDPLELLHDGVNYVHLPGTAGNFLSTPDAAVLDIVGDIDIRDDFAPDDLTPAAEGTISSKYLGAGDQRSWYLALTVAGALRLYWSPDGTVGALLVEESSVTLGSVGIQDGGRVQVRAYLDASTGDVVFEYRTDGIVDSASGWTALGATQAGSATSIHSGSAAVEIGSLGGGATRLAGSFYRTQVYDGIDGTLVFDYNPQVSFTVEQANSAVVTVNLSATGAKCVEVSQNVFLLHTDDYFEVLDHADLDFSDGEPFTAVAVFRTHNWAGSGTALVSKKTSSSVGTVGWQLNFGNEKLEALISDGTNRVIANSPTGLTAGDIIAGAARRDASDLTGYADAVAGTPTSDDSGDLSNGVTLRIGRFSGGGTSYEDFEFFALLLFREDLSPQDLAFLGNEIVEQVA